MEAEDDGRRIGRYELGNQIGDRVVVMRGQWEGSRQRMIPRPVPFGKHRRPFRVESIAVNDICEELSKGKPECQQIGLDIKDGTSQQRSQETPTNLLLVPASPGSNPCISQMA